MHLDDADYTAIREHALHHRAALEALGLDVVRGDDMVAFAASRRALGGYVHPALDPAHSRLPEGTAQWIAAYAANEGPLVCVAATRLYDRESAHHLFQSRRIWGDRAAPVVPPPPIDLAWSGAPRRIAGRLMLGGGMEVAAPWRGRRIGVHVMQLLRAASVIDWVPETIIGLHVPRKVETAMTSRHFGYPHSEVSFTRRTRPDTGPRHDTEVFSWVTLDEYLRDIRSGAENGAGMPLDDQGLGNDELSVRTG